jgi:TonB family protein
MKARRNTRSLLSVVRRAGTNKYKQKLNDGAEVKARIGIASAVTDNVTNSTIERMPQCMPATGRPHAPPRIAVAGTLLLLACCFGAHTARADSVPIPSYVPAQSIPCSYGWSIDDLKSAQSFIGHERRPDVTVRASVAAHGQVSDVVVEQSSGNPELDNLALQASRRAECKPYVGASGEPVAVETNFVFGLPQARVIHLPAEQGVATAASDAPATGGLAMPSFPSMPAVPSLLAAAAPLEFGHPLDAAGLTRFGIAPDSPKAKMFVAWAQKLVSDPDIKRFFTVDGDPAKARASAFTHVGALLDGMARISPEDRAQLANLTTRALDNAPPDCGGLKNLPAITSRYLSLADESDDELRKQLQAIYDLIKQSTQTDAPPQITPGQRLRGQLAVSASIAQALQREPAETEDLGRLLTGKQAELSSDAWCKAVRFYRQAVDATPQPSRDWVMLGELDTQRRTMAVIATALKNAAALKAAHPSAAVPEVFDYAERVRQRVRPNILWTGKAAGQQTVIEVHCASSGMLETARILQPSGDPTWDQAALQAVLRSDPMPLDENGEARRSFTITLTPGA